MNRTSTLAPLMTGLLLAGGAVHATSPEYLYGASTDTYGAPAAVATTTGTEFDNRSGYVLAAIADSTGGLEVKAWQDTTHALTEVGHVHADSNTVMATAAAGLDSTHVVTADVDIKGVLSLRTWTLGGGAGIAQVNHYASSESTANPLGMTPFLGMVDLTATQVVTAYEDSQQNLVLQAWTVGSTTASPVKAGAAANGGPATQIAIAEIDSATVMTAVVTGEDELQVTTWGVDGTGVHYQDQYVMKNVVGGLYPSVAIGATTVETVAPLGQFPQFKFTRYAFTPIVNKGNLIEVIDWQISSAGKISMVGKPSIGGPDDFAFAVAGSMLQTGVPITVYADLTGPGDENNVTVGWFEKGFDSEFTAISGLFTDVNSVASATAGNDFNVLVPVSKVNAYFVTGAQTSGGGLPPSPSNKGEFKLRVWSYPIVLPMT